MDGDVHRPLPVLGGDSPLRLVPQDPSGREILGLWRSAKLGCKVPSQVFEPLVEPGCEVAVVVGEAGWTAHRSFDIYMCAEGGPGMKLD